MSESRNGSGNGKEMLRWLLPMVLAALVAYFTTISAIQSELTDLRSTGEARWEEVLRRLDRIERKLP